MPDLTKLAARSGEIVSGIEEAFAQGVPRSQRVYNELGPDLRNFVLSNQYRETPFVSANQAGSWMVGNTDTGPKRALGNRSSFVAKGLPTRSQPIGRHYAL
jgi:hypothetical protein